MEKLHKIISDYGVVLEKLPKDQILHPISKLPYPKIVIEEALKLAIRKEENSKRKDDLKMCLIFLKDFVPDKDMPADYLGQIERFSELNE